MVGKCLTDSQYARVYDLVGNLIKINWGCWPDAATWPDIGGVGYTITQYEGGGVVVKFDCPVHYGDQTGRRWVFGMSPRGACRMHKPHEARKEYANFPA